MTVVRHGFNHRTRNLITSINSADVRVVPSVTNSIGQYGTIIHHIERTRVLMRTLIHRLTLRLIGIVDGCLRRRGGNGHRNAILGKDRVSHAELVVSHLAYIRLNHSVLHGDCLNRRIACQLEAVGILRT